MSFALSPSGQPGEGNSGPLRSRTVRRAAAPARDGNPSHGIIIRRGGRSGPSAARRARGDGRACKYQGKYKREWLLWPLGLAPSRDQAFGISSKSSQCASADASGKAPAIKPEQARRGAGEAAEAARQPAGFAPVSLRPGCGIIEPGRGPAGRSHGPAARIVNPCRSLLMGQRRRPRKPGWSPARAGRPPTSAIVNPCKRLLIHQVRPAEPVRSGHSSPAGMDRAGHGRHHRG
jgi:hypothetical protein